MSMCHINWNLQKNQPAITLKIRINLIRFVRSIPQLSQNRSETNQNPDKIKSNLLKATL